MSALRDNLNIPGDHSRKDIRVMIVDDSAVARAVLERMLLQAGVSVVCSAESSEDALAYLDKNSVDIVLLDIEMPGRSGLEALPDISARIPEGRILIVSSFAERSGPAAIKALSLGACDTIAKPGRTGYSGDFSRQLIEKVVRLGQNRKVGRPVSTVELPEPAEAVSYDVVPDCITIGASTGGIPAIYEIVEQLPASLQCPVLITQHLPHAFMSFFANQLSSLAQREVVIAAEGTEIEPGKIYLAPGNSHLNCCRNRGSVVIMPVDDEQANRYCPSVDVMLNSVAECYGGGVMAIILSGMGNDGAAAAPYLSSQGATIIVQDAETSVVWGMPGAIMRQGLASAMMKPAKIAEMISQLGPQE